MIKKIGVLALVLCLLVAILSPSLAQAQSGLAVIGSSAEAVFPSRLNFSLSAQSDENITDIRLCYVMDRAGFAEVISEVYIEFVPAATVDVGWALEMIKTGGLPPGSSVEYWWKLTDDGGNQLATEPAQVQFDDTRYDWRSLTEGKVTLFWYSGDDAFIQELMAATQADLEGLAEDTGAELERPARLYIYADSGDLQGAMIFPQEWTGGVAFTRYSTMAIGISPENISWGKDAIAHELTHLVIHQITLNPYNDLPTWLDEGLAMRSEGMLGSEFSGSLGEAIAGGSIISVQSLCSPFSAYSGEAILSYAQSHSLVEFLITSYGQSKMFELLTTFKRGSGYDDALEAVYGFDMDELDSLWREYVNDKYQAAVGS
ncbi:MAG: peptidase MA domain-containing protein [Deltaproteobacteria bacterium]|nr:peptidase MA domain-containing protein [Deltaproteobacteria bacterium]